MNLAMRFLLPLLVALLLFATASFGKQRAGTGAPARPAAAAANLKIAYLHLPKVKDIFPYFDPPAADAGLQGARLGIEDNNTTGSFTGQRFELTEVTVGGDEDPVAAFQRLVADGYRHVLVDLPAEAIERLQAVPGFERGVIYDVAASDDRLRGTSCSGRVLHLLPSRAMRADALAQFLVKKRWTKWFLVIGPRPADRLFAEAVERAAKRFGGRVVARKEWQQEFDERRTPEAQIPVFTQGVEHDVLIVADEEGAFGDLLAYRTWLPRPVAGTQGLVPAAWHYTHEAWGALQLQNRFRERAGRWMREQDYGAWLAIRAIGEASVRTRSLDFDTLLAFLRSDAFTLAGFKGVPLSFRAWDGQLRQPVLLAQARALVTVAPVEGFLHPKNELDTLGYDQTESACHANS